MIDTHSTQSFVDGVAGASPNGYFTYSVPITFGVAFSIYMEVDAVTTAGPSSSDAFASAAADASHSFDWAGIQAVDVGGIPFNYTLSSSSGTDYRKSFVVAAVPEPTSIILLAVGMFAIGLLKRGNTDKKAQVLKAAAPVQASGTEVLIRDVG